MLNIPELERRWLRYKIKSYIPYIIIAISIIIITIITIILINSQTQKAQSAEPAVNAQKHLKVPETLIQTTLEQSPVNNQTQTLTPSMNFIKQMEHSSQPYYNNYDVEKREISTTKKATEVKKNIQEKVSKPTLQQTAQEEYIEPLSKKITIKRKNTDKDISEIISRFKNNNNPALSLFVAKKYYEMGNYHQSYNYALITNQINNEIEDSWIIFAKSLVKLGKKNMAIKSLNEYIKISHSSSAQTLLDSIILGKFQ